MQQTADALWEVTEPEIFGLDHYLSSANAPDVEEDVRLCIKSGSRMMVLDCSVLSYMTGAGARAILNIARTMRDAGGNLFVKGLKGQPRDIFSACGLDLIVPSADNLENVSALSA
ncbi:MAG: STAS domain-containing protein [Alphaproteobacteria bacterium]|nr:STAS domain-containing protein [Alphaproteobacteria bacterium]